MSMDHFVLQSIRYRKAIRKPPGAFVARRLWLATAGARFTDAASQQISS
jgi:hypothetical protein